MNKTKENLLLHPVRMRILLATGTRQVTAQQLANELPDIPQATLYRNIRTLAAAGMLVVVQERRVHNTIEKTYALAPQDTFLTVEDLKNAQPSDYIRLFTQFLGQLEGYYVRYIKQGNVDLARDHLLFQAVPLYLSDEEILRLGRDLTEALSPYVKNEPAPERQRYVLGLINLLDVTGKKGE
jgi:hypothetical protein